MELRLLSAADVDRAVTMPDAVECMARAFLQLSSGRAIVPQRLGLTTDRGLVLAMPGFLPDQQSLAVKLVTVFPDNARRDLPSIYGLVTVLDADTGSPRAHIEGGHLTAVRTGATSALAARHMARPNAAIVALFGAGTQARTQLAGLRAVRDVREVRIVSRTPASAERFAAELSGIDVHVVTDPAAAVTGADIVVTATTSATPLVRGYKLSPGAHVNAIGAYTPEMREVDSATIRCARVVVDTRAGAMAEAGDILLAIAEGAIDAGHIAGELGEVVNGAVPGRTSDQEITLFKSVGNAAQDVALAKHVLDVAEAQDIGTVVTL